MANKKISIIIPVYNEEGNIEPLYHELLEVLELMIKSNQISLFEIIFVNDGSNDKTSAILESLTKKDKNVRAIEFKRNFGQTSAFKAGFDYAKGDFIITMDGDLQNDPKDIPKLLNKLNQGYDVASGWRHKRKDKFTKTISSRIMNNLRQIIIGDYLHDYGCSLKIYKKECIQDLELFGELHRYITAYLYIKGYKIGEIKVNHRARKAGKTKYSFNRGLNGILDLLFLKFWKSFSHRPLHFLGRLGIYQWLIAFLIVIEQIIKSYIIGRLEFGPLLALASMLAITGLITIIFGFLFEIVSRLYFKEKDIYSIRKLYNLK